jgi:ubiquinone biosynthesis protein UbiJ
MSNASFQSRGERTWPPLPPRFDAWLLPSLPLLYAVNRLLASEPWAIETLRPFAGKSARLVLGPFSVTLVISNQVRFALAKSALTPDLTLTVPVSDITALAMAPDRAAALLKIEGDSDFAQALALVARNLRPDLEEQLSRVVGDALSVRIMAGLNAFAEAVRASRRRAAENLAEYLLEEQPLLVRTRDVNDLAAELRVLRDDLARLEKRIEHLSPEL